MSKTLEQKNTGYLLIWLPVVLLVGSALFFAMLTMHSRHAQEEQLELKQRNIWEAFRTQPASIPMQIQGEYKIMEGNVLPTKLSDAPRDKSIMDTEEGELKNFRSLTRQYVLSGKKYQLTTFVSTKEFFHLTIKVFVTEAFVFLSLLIAIAVINRKSSRRLWQPFYETLKRVSQYDVVRNPSIKLKQHTGITEFNQMNVELTTLIGKVNQAYNNQKQFVENASHEIQTPLAIIRSKLDLLINDSSLTERSAALLGDITEANERLSQMNKSLLLLAKIDNNQFPDHQQLNISDLVKDILGNYQEHYEEFPSLSESIEPDVYLNANPALAEILFSNLIKNAVVHNIPGGFIRVRLNHNEFSIENTGQEITQNTEQLFERFRKGNADTKTTGLGLALTRQISQLYNLGLHYHYVNGIHRLILTFHEHQPTNQS